MRPIEHEANIRARLMLALMHQGNAKAAQAVLTKWAPKSDRSEHRAQKAALIEEFKDSPFEAQAAVLGKLLR